MSEWLCTPVHCDMVNVTPVIRPWFYKRTELRRKAVTNQQFFDIKTMMILYARNYGTTGGSRLLQTRGWDRPTTSTLMSFTACSISRSGLLHSCPGFFLPEWGDIYPPHTHTLRPHHSTHTSTSNYKKNSSASPDSLPGGCCNVLLGLCTADHRKQNGTYLLALTHRWSLVLSSYFINLSFFLLLKKLSWKLCTSSIS